MAELETSSSDAAVARRAETRARAAAFARGSRAPSTWRAYDAKWRRFTAWCLELGEEALPAEPQTVAEFLADLAAVWRPATPTDPVNVIVEGQVLVRDGLRPATVEAYRAAISVAHRSAGEPNPCEHEAVRRVVSGIRCQRGLTPTRRRTALRPADMTAVLAATRPDERLVDARDAALLLIGWKAALHTDDLHRLDITDLKVESPETTGGVVDGGGLAVRLRRSKTDQTGTTVTVGITSVDPLPDGSPDLLDAVAAWRRWHNQLRAQSKLESRSRGTSISTGPISVSTVFVRVPLREFPPSRPATACLS